MSKSDLTRRKYLALLGGGATLAAGVVAAILDANASGLYDRLTAEQSTSTNHAIPASDRSSFYSARTGA